MNLPLRVPQAGEPVSATKFAALVREVRANKILPSPGLNISRGPNGTHLGFQAARAKGGPPTGDIGCFCIKTRMSDDDPPKVEHYFDNQYFMAGDILRECALDTTVEELIAEVDSSGVDEDDDGVEDETPVFVALRLSAMTSITEDMQDYGEDDEELPRLEIFETLEDLVGAQADIKYHVIPLYKLGVTVDDETDERTFIVRCDFRRGVFAQQWEDAFEADDNSGSGTP